MSAVQSIMRVRERLLADAAAAKRLGDALSDAAVVAHTEAQTLQSEAEALQAAINRLAEAGAAKLSLEMAGEL